VSVLVAILAVVLLGLVVLLVSAPIRRARELRPGPGASAGSPAPDGQRHRSDGSDPGGLQSAREAKYREIRDAELDYRTGKLSREDYEAIDSALRAEAIEILNRLDAVDPGGEEGESGDRAGGERSS